MIGSLLSNLDMAVTSARRLRDKPVYPDTMKHWEAMLRIARAKLQHTLHPTERQPPFSPTSSRKRLRDAARPRSRSPGAMIRVDRSSGPGCLGSE